jgi:hypothetical protein
VAVPFAERVVADMGMDDRVVAGRRPRRQGPHLVGEAARGATVPGEFDLKRSQLDPLQVDRLGDDREERLLEIDPHFDELPLQGLQVRDDVAERRRTAVWEPGEIAVVLVELPPQLGHGASQPVAAPLLGVSPLASLRRAPQPLELHDSLPRPPRQHGRLSAPRARSRRDPAGRAEGVPA